jgi:hypothetical protein
LTLRKRVWDGVSLQCSFDRGLASGVTGRVVMAGIVSRRIIRAVLGEDQVPWNLLNQGVTGRIVVTGLMTGWVIRTVLGETPAQPKG